MAFRKRYNELRKDTKRKLETSDKSWTPILPYKIGIQRKNFVLT